jgi:hypothetical protein
MSLIVPVKAKTDEWTRWTAVRVLRFLEIIKPFPCLWNPLSEDYRHEETCNTAYQTVCQEVKVDVGLIKEKILHYRNIFIQQLAEIKQNPNVAIKLHWYNEAQFFLTGIADHELSCGTVKPLYPLQREQKSKPKLYPTLSKRTCRVCLETNRSSTPMETENIFLVFKECTGFDVLLNRGSYMPTHICNKCKAALLSCKLFLNQSKKTENILKQIYQCKDRPSASQLFIKLQIENEEIEMINQQLKDVETLQSKEKVKVSTECSMDTLIKKEGTTDDESLCEEVKILVEPMPIIKLRKRKGMVFMFFPKR